MDGKMVLCKQAEEFVKYIFKIYLEDRDFDRFIPMLHEDITWIGTGISEICKNYSDALKLLNAEEKDWDGYFSIKEQWYKSIPISDDCCTVLGELKFSEGGLNTILLDMHSRFSMICKKVNGELKLYHAHFSAPNAAQSENEYIQKPLIENYDLLLEEKLLERTNMLREKMNELEILTNNICGGIQICNMDDDLNILYMSKGFYEITGYTEDEIHRQFNGKYLKLVYEQDAKAATNEFLRQIGEKGAFSLEYRIARKDGKIIWVLDKGNILKVKHGDTHIQSILTDITAQKEQAEALRISEQRYEIAMQLTDISMFEYDILTNELILFSDISYMYDVSKVVKSGPETLIELGIITPSSAPAYLEMYRKIREGTPTASCFISTKNKYGTVNDYELTLISIFDDNQKPVRAIGVRKNISQIKKLQKEKKFGKTLVSGKLYIFEADVTNNTLLYLHPYWKTKYNLPPNLSFDDMKSKIFEECIAPEHHQLLATNLSHEFIKSKYENNESLISFHYKRKEENGYYEWQEAIMNIIKDDVTHVLYIRFYMINIHEKKLKEQKAQEEQCLYKAMLHKVSIAYEVNISQNLAITGHAHWKDSYGIQSSDDYSEMILAFSKKGLHPEDGPRFYELFSREHVLEHFYNDGRPLSYQYRKTTTGNNYSWVNCALHLFEDPETGDIRGYSYIEDIDEQKREELTLKYNAEHDLMTDSYNKMVTSEKIIEYLENPDSKNKMHAFIIIDIDYFKRINDNFGHYYGDKVLKEIAIKIKQNFRENDIVGRLGGDEFCVFIKDISYEDAAKLKAQKLCESIAKCYVKDNKSCQISASIGIAIYPKHDRTYTGLYKHADNSLYIAKNNGRNRYYL